MTTANTAPELQHIVQTLSRVTQEHNTQMARDLLLQVSVDRPTATIGELLSAFAEGNPMHDAISGLQILTLKEIFTPVPEVKESKRKSAKAPKVQVPSVEDFSKDEVKNGFVEAVHQTILSHGKGDSGRGISPSEIRMALGRGSEPQTREALKILATSNRVWGTGTTKGLRYVDVSLQAEAQSKYDEEKKAKDAKVKPAKAA